LVDLCVDGRIRLKGIFKAVCFEYMEWIEMATIGCGVAICVGGGDICASTE
jgi:hypothetical protein